MMPRPANRAIDKLPCHILDPMIYNWLGALRNDDLTNG